MNKIGLREPARLAPTLQYVFNENTGMEYEQFSDDFGQLYMSACHEDVGLVTWYAITQDDWNNLPTTDKE